MEKGHTGYNHCDNAKHRPNYNAYTQYGEIFLAAHCARGFALSASTLIMVWTVISRAADYRRNNT
jgi:hypothetical protein